MSYHPSSTEPATLVDLLRQRALDQPSQYAFTFLEDGEAVESHMSYGELDQHARAIAAALQQLAPAGARALLLYPPGLEFIAAFFGCLYAGVVAVPAYPPDPARLDRTLPRLRAIAEDASPLVALTTAPILGLIEALGSQGAGFPALRWLATDTLAAATAADWQEMPIADDALAFLQYTSGSTATPKGVMVSHANLLHNQRLIRAGFAHDAQTVVVGWLPLYHDMGLIGNVLQPLYLGVPCVLMSPFAFLQRPLRWLQAMTRYQATTSGGPNFAYDLCVRKIMVEQRAALDLRSWRVAYNGAEPVRSESLQRFAAAFAPCGFRAEAFYPCYGLAEATLFVTGGQAGTPPVVLSVHAPALARDSVVAVAADAPDARSLVGAGRAWLDQQVLIVDPASRTRCPPDRVGEIWVAGPSVAQGYWQRPDETAQTFQATLAGSGVGPFLRTGDLGFVRDDALFVAGRLKDLIIIRGRNLYPQDIELTVERSHAALRPGCGAAFAIDLDGEERLVVVQEVERQQREVDIALVAGAIRRAVASQHAVQVYVVVLIPSGSIPKTSSGKIQRHACRAAFLDGTIAPLGSDRLADPDAVVGDAPPSRELLLGLAPAARRSVLERRLRAAAARALRVAPARLDPQQPLTTLGLDSLAAIDLQHMIESELGLVVPLARLLEGQGLDSLAAELLDELVAAPTPALPLPTPVAAEAGIYPLSYGQRALWFLQQLAPQSAAYHLAGAARIRGDLDLDALRRAFQALVDRHATLRTIFPARDGDPVQQIRPRAELCFVELDATSWTTDMLDARLVAETQRPFDLAAGPLLRVSVFRRTAREHVLLLVVHHLVADLWSLGVLLHELDALYPAARAGRALELNRAPFYADYVQHQAMALDGAAGERLWDYWRAQLADVAPTFDLVGDRLRPALQTYQGAMQAFRLAPELTVRLRALAQANGTTLYMTLLAAFQALLYRYSGQPTIIVGSPTTGRNRSEAAGLVGYCVNPLVLRAELSGTLSYAGLLGQARATVLAAFAHQEYPFALLVERLQPQRDASRSPLFQVMFALQKAQLLDQAGLSAFALGLNGARMQLAGLEFEAIAPTQQAVPFDLALLMAEAADGLAGALHYNVDLFDATTIQRMAGHIQALLEQVVADPARSIGELSLMRAAERQQVFVEWNDTTVGVRGQGSGIRGQGSGVRDQGSGVRSTIADACLHELFEAQAARTPDAVALVYDFRDKETGRLGDKETGRQRDRETTSRTTNDGSAFSVHLTYQELDRRANQLARHLRALGAGPEVRVGLCLERSPELVLGILGILKAGAAYLPLDPAYPQERLAFMIEDSRAQVLITDSIYDLRLTIDDLEESDTTIVNRKSKIVDLRADWPTIAQTSTQPPVAIVNRQYEIVNPDNLAYVIYTSGSTGQPKGVLVERRNLAQTMRASQRRFGFRPGDVVPWIASAAFDIALFECFGPLLAGGTTLILAQNELLDMTRLLAHLARASVFHTLPSLMAQIVQAINERPTRQRYDHIRMVFVGGDAVPPELLADLRRVFPRAAVHVLYGPTEATLFATSYSALRAGGVAQRLIGRPLENVHVRLLDARGQPVPIGIVGELYIGGDGVARGYLDRPDLTAELFVPDPFAGDKETRRQGDKEIGSAAEDRRQSTIYNLQSAIGTRLYRTGDRARYRPEGTLEFLGRVDGQVKLRGFRIELGEIEAVLRQHAAVRNAVVLAREDHPGDQRLVAYVVPTTGQGDRETRRQGDKETAAPPVTVSPLQPGIVSELRTFLKERLPEHMVPAAFVSLAALPLTPNGKLDLRALPAPELARPSPSATFLAPRSAVERVIAEIWQAVLHVERVGLDDNFFDLGGHSLLVVQVQRKLREALGREIAIISLFSHPTVSALAQHIHQAQAGALAEPVEASRAMRRRRATSSRAGDEPAGIAIIGLAGRFPGAPTVATFWQNLCAGVESIAFFSDEELAAAGVDPAALGDPSYVKARALLDDVEQFDAAFFGMSPREAASLDPQQRVFLECAWEALECAGYASEQYPGAIGVYAGASMNSYLGLQLAAQPDLLDTLGAFQLMLLNDKDHLTTRAAYKLNLSGPCITVQTACSTSLVAVHLACQSLLNGECDLALAGGVSVRLPQQAGYWYQEGGILSPDGHCRAFDAQAQGTVIGAGVGVVVLKPLADALADGDPIAAVIKGSAVNNDGALKVGYSAPSVERQSEVIAEALAVAGVAPATISYVETHGTGTALGDPIEIAALARVFDGQQPTGGCAIGSVKPNIGHLDAAAGIAGLIKTVLALHHRQLPPSLNFSTPNPQIDFAQSPFVVNTQLRDWTADGPRRAGVSSFGMGGTNAHVVLEEAPPIASSGPSRDWQLLLISAKTPTALETATDSLAAHLGSHPDQPLADVAYTLHVGRRAFGERRALVCRDQADALRVLEMRDPARLLTRGEVQRDRPVVFLIPGQGAQYAGMAHAIYESEPVFRTVVDQCAALLEPQLGLDLRAIIFDESGQGTIYRAPTDEGTDSSSQDKETRRQEDKETDNSQDKETRRQGDASAPCLPVSVSPGLASGTLLDQTQYAQPALFVVAYALAQLWMSWGVQPQAMLGHSLGEYVAACLAGVLSLNDALALIALRGRLMQTLPAGAMLSVALPEHLLVARLSAELALAAVNAPALCVVSGPPQAIAALHEQLRAEGVECRQLHTSHAFHSAMIDPILERFAAAVAGVALHPPRLPYVSSLTGRWITAAEASDPAYWTRQLRETVRFADAVRTLNDVEQILLEVGPGQTLCTLVRQQLAGAAGPLALASLPHPHERQPADAFLLGTLGQLWLAGARIDWDGFYRDERRRRVVLPTYPFERQRYWVDPPERANAPGLPEAAGEKRVIADWFYRPVWKQALPLRPCALEQRPARRSRWLVFADADGIGARLAERLAQMGDQVVVVEIGPRYAQRADGYTLDPGSVSDYDALIARLRARDQLPDQIIHAWSLLPTDAPVGAERFAQAQRVGCYSLLWLAQALAKQHVTDPLRIWLVASGLHELESGDVVCPEQATLLGPCRVIPQEYPQIACHCIEIVPPAPGSRAELRLIDQLLAEFDAAPAAGLIAYRGRQRWVQTYERLPLAAAPATPMLRADGVYVVGTAGPGLALARYLAQTVQARLVLIGPADLPPEADWPRWLATHDPRDVVSCAITAMQELGDAEDVLMIGADVVDEGQLRAAIDLARARFGAINGVVYAAELDPAFRTISEIDQAECERQFRQRAHGLYVLERVLHDQPLDFCLLAGSLSAVLGGLGLSVYSAANLFVDAFAQCHNQAHAVPWISVGWDVWQPEDEPVARAAGARGRFITPAEGAESFRRILAGAAGLLPQIVVSTSDLGARIAQWIAHAPTPVALTRQPAAGALYARPQLANAYVEPESATEQRIAEVWQELLGIEPIGIYDDFFQLGGHSLLGTQLISRLRALFEVDLSLRMLFEAPTVAEMALVVESLLLAEIEALADDEDLALVG